MIQFYFDRRYWDFDGFRVSAEEEAAIKRMLAERQGIKLEPEPEKIKFKALKRKARKLLSKGKKKPEDANKALKLAADVEQIILLLQAYADREQLRAELLNELAQIQAMRRALLLMFLEQEKEDEELLLMLL